MSSPFKHMWIGDAMLCIIISFLFLSISASPSLATIASPSPSPLLIKGVDLFPFTSDVLATDAVYAELDEIVSIGGNTVAINYMLGQDNATANQVYQVPGTTPPLSVLGSFIEEAHARGLAVLLKPLIVCGGDCLMPNIIPSDPEAWFASYSAYMLPLATFAQNYSVEYLSIALELYQMTSNDTYTPYFRSLIPSLRANFQGLLTYSSIFFPVETQHVAFWDLLDFISADTYVPLMSKNDTTPPTLDQMQTTFTDYFGYVRQWLDSQPANVSSLPYIFSEIGYPSSVAGLIAPFANPPDNCTSDTPEPDLQADAFQAFFTAANNNTSWFRGAVIFWFDNPTTSDYYGNYTTNGWACGWTPRYKPAETVIAKAFASWE